MFNFDCKYRLGSNSPAVCLWQSQRLGQIAYTSYLFCERCPLEVRSSGSENKDFLKTCFNRRYDENFLNKLYNKYSSSTKIIVPDNWNKINNFFSSYKKQPWFVDMGLTGSLIVDGVLNHKDIDIIFWIKNIEEYVEWLNKNSLPQFFENSKIDYYIFLEPFYQFFISLWPNQKKIYTSKYFNAQISSANDFEIVKYEDNKKLLDFYDIVDL
jgi:hypothetical protein